MIILLYLQNRVITPLPLPLDPSLLLCVYEMVDFRRISIYEVSISVFLYSSIGRFTYNLLCNPRVIHNNILIRRDFQRQSRTIGKYLLYGDQQHLLIRTHAVSPWTVLLVLNDATRKTNFYHQTQIKIAQSFQR